jgi:hypothetical protein
MINSNFIWNLVDQEQELYETYVHLKTLDRND